MKMFKNVLLAGCIMYTCSNFAQSKEQKEVKTETKETKPKENSSEETVTKIIRIKGANGEEKVITQQQVITKKSKIKLNPDEEDGDTNRTALYAPETVSIKNGGTTSNEKIYKKIADGKGYILTLIDETGEKTSKARPISNGYYLIHMGAKDNCLGRFDQNKNLILEMFDQATNAVVQKKYTKTQ